MVCLMKASLQSTSFSIFCFGLYMMLVPGAGLMLIPDVLLDLFQLRHGSADWIPRLLGFLAFAIGAYYYYIAQYRLSSLYPITVRLRGLAALFMVGLWAMGRVEIMILLFAAADTAGALWTAWTLRR